MSESTGLRIAIYGDVNTNIIDGSSVWLRNITRLCVGVPGARVDLFLKAPVERDHLLSGLSELGNLVIREPAAGQLHGAPLLTPEQAINSIARLDESEKYTAIILRGADVCLVAANNPGLSDRLWPYLTDIPQRLTDFTDNFRNNIECILKASRFLLCQTEELRNFLSNVLAFDQHQLVLLAPLGPDSALKAVTEPGTPPCIFYSGKFSPAWAVETLVDIIVNAENVSLRVAGDKFHCSPKDPCYKERLESKLSNTAGIEWLGALEPEKIFEIQASMDVGFAWRHPELDASLELSTKLLEYGAGGLAVITNPTPPHVALLGKDYPFFAADEQQLKALIISLPLIGREIEQAGKLCQSVSRAYIASAFQENWNALFAQVYRPSITPNSRPLKVVRAGHDLKFARELIEYFEARNDIELKIDKWASLREHDESLSRKLADWTDIVFCEWCAGNAVWYANNIDSADTRLFIRFHRIELLMEFAPVTNMDNVEKIFFVGPHILEQAKKKFDWPEEKLSILPNFVDTSLYARPKFSGAEFNLGLIGFVPRLKRLDRALDILKALRNRDRRYRLFVKGRFPWEYPWIWRKPEEKQFYEECLNRIKTDVDLQEAVVFETFGSDIALWLRKIGVILSVSDLESFHMALAEGISAQCYPVLWEREGARELFPWISLYNCADSLAENLLHNNSDEERVKHRSALIDRYDMNKTMQRLDKLIG